MHRYSEHIAENSIHTFIILDKDGQTTWFKGIKPDGKTYFYPYFGCHNKDTYGSGCLEPQGIVSYTDIESAWHTKSFDDWLYSRHNISYKPRLYHAYIPAGTMYYKRLDSDRSETDEYALYSRYIIIDPKEIEFPEYLKLKEHADYIAPIPIIGEDD